MTDMRVHMTRKQGRGSVPCFFAFVLALACGPVAAYLDYVPLMSVGAWNNISNVHVAQWSKYVRSGAAPAAGTAAPVATTLSVGRERSGAVAKIAAAYPAERRAEVERVLNELLESYPKFERLFGIPPRDLAGAVATFVAGSYEAYRNTEVPDEDFKRLVVQVRGIVAANPEFRRAGEAEKREAYEQMAVLGLFMLGTRMALQQQPNAALTTGMQQAGREYLEQLLKTDPQRITISARGLEIR
jgi:hypothetical protein